MKRTLQLLLLLVSIYSADAQLLISNNQTPQEASGTLFSDGLTSVSNVQFNGSTANAQVVHDQASAFTTNFISTNLGFSQGVILSTGKTTVALGPNNLANASNLTATPVYGDPDLALLTTNTVTTKSALEFDFVAYESDLALNYVFASEEYPEYVNTDFNDVMGIFLSGPGISGPFSGNAQNIALVPNTTVPVAINNVNNGSNNAGPCEFCNYYVNNGTGSTPATNSSIQYDGFTQVLTASATLTPGQTYHIKFAIANVGDNNWDSALFIKGKTFPTASCLPEDKCTYTFTLTDSDGDGLNGQVMTVNQSGHLVTQLFDSQGDTNNTIFDFNVPLCPNQPFELFWNLSGTNPSELGAIIKNPFGQVIYNKPAGVGIPGTLLYDGVADCFDPLKIADFDAIGFAISPNPAKTDFKITANGNQKISTVQLFSSLGNLIRTVDSSIDRIDVSDLSQGVYLVKIMTENGSSETKKLIVQ